MNPFKWFCRWVIAEELSDFEKRITVQEGEITRLMKMIRNDGSDAAEQIGSLHIVLRAERETKDRLMQKIAAALEVHDKAKAPNATVKRIARILREA